MKILIIGQVWPEPSSSAAGSRMMQLINCFKYKGCDLHFACSATPGERAVDLQKVNVQIHKIQLNHDSFDAFAKALHPQVVIYDRFMIEEQYGWRVAESCPDALRILDTEDLHGLRNARIEAFKKKQDFKLSFLHNDVMKRELASIYRCDLSLIISEFEMELLSKTFYVPEQQLFYLPFMLADTSKAIKSEWKAYDQTSDFMSIGNFKHWPNYDALLYLKKEIWPLIRLELPQARLNVYGAYSSQKIEQLHHEKEGFIINGYAKSAPEVTRKARVSLAALRVGAGLKGKILEAMQYGTPCVSTPIGAEGMHGDLAFNGIIAKDASTFAAAAVQLHKDEHNWNEAREQGYLILKERFSEKFWVPGFLEKLEILSKNLQEHRINNFTGATLWHQSLQATRYLSKWITLKNADDE